MLAGVGVCVGWCEKATPCKTVVFIMVGKHTNTTANSTPHTPVHDNFVLLSIVSIPPITFGIKRLQFNVLNLLICCNVLVCEFGTLGTRTLNAILGGMRHCATAVRGDIMCVHLLCVRECYTSHTYFWQAPLRHLVAWYVLAPRSYHCLLSLSLSLQSR